ncbi:MAG: hypothetical protein OXC40_06590 [Proteobacteria bacterium]|nr:hypothetical protein [Pseudomonadota bacterium]
MSRFYLVTILLCLLVNCKSHSFDGKFDNKHNASLQGIYDDQYIMRLVKLTNYEWKYRFEVCHHESNITNPGFCINPFKNKEGRDITFTLDPISTVDFSSNPADETKPYQLEWQQYQKSLRQALPQVNPMHVAGLGAGALLTTSLATGGYSEWFHRYKIDSLHRTGVSTIEEAKKKLQQVSYELAKDGLSINEIDNFFKNFLDLKQLQGVQHIFSNEFEAVIRQALAVSSNKITRDRATYLAAVSFVKQHSHQAVINPKFYAPFTRYYLLKHRLLPQTKQFQGSVHLLDLDKTFLEKPKYFLGEIEQFILDKGNIQKYLSARHRHLMNRGKNLKTIIRLGKAPSSRAAQKIFKNFRLSAKIILLTTAGATLSLLALDQLGNAASSAPSNNPIEESYHILMGEENVATQSVEQTLKYFVTYQTMMWPDETTDEMVIYQYCLPGSKPTENKEICRAPLSHS